MRARALGLIFGIGMAVAGINYLTYEAGTAGEMSRLSFGYVFLFMLGCVLFECMALVKVSRRIAKSRFHVSSAGRYLNAGIEVLSPAVIMFLLAPHFSIPANVIHSPAAYIYFLFIIVSTLRLDFWLSVFTGCVASLSFSLLAILVQQEYASGSGPDFRVITGKAIILLISGLLAGMVGERVRRSINRTLSAIDQQNRVTSLFGQQVSRSVVEAMLKEQGDMRSRLRRVTVMFVDIRNFTAQVATHSPEEIVEYQNRFFSIVVRSVERQGGIINQFLGDGCMATFGAPADLANSCGAAVRAAMDIRLEVQRGFRAGDFPFEKIGIGIHTGEAVTGNIGTAERKQYSITGGVVVLASRIEQLNKSLRSEILVSAAVYEKAKQQLAGAGEFIHHALLKGWNEPIGIYRLA